MTGKSRAIHNLNENANVFEKKDPTLDLLVSDILAVCEDENSKEYYKKIAKNVGEQTIRKALSEVKEVRDTGRIIKSKGALFTALIKKYAAQQGVLFLR